MSTPTPQTWHYGLVARWWAEFNHDGPEISYFQSIIERHGTPALDLACGAGRLLLPFLRADLDVDGVDLSPDMIAMTRQRAAAEGLAPNLYVQPMHALDLPRRYRTITICGSFGLGGTRKQDREALRRIHAHLEPGGVLAFDHHLPYSNSATWRYWLKDRRAELPLPWPDSGMRKQAADSTEIELRIRQTAFNPLEERWTSEIRATHWQGTRQLAQEEHTLQANSYFRNELLLLLELTGFREVQVFGAYTDAPATPDDDILVFIATR